MIRKLIVALSIAGAALGATACQPVSNPCVGVDYRHGGWYDADDVLVGVAPTEDSPVRCIDGRWAAR